LIPRGTNVEDDGAAAALELGGVRLTAGFTPHPDSNTTIMATQAILRIGRRNFFTKNNTQTSTL
jgi:hypothetical protein